MENTNRAYEEANIQENPETEVETGTEETETTDWPSEWETKSENKWQSKAAKLLAQRNEARREADELAERLAKIESRFQEEDNSRVQKAKDNFVASYWEEALKKAEEVKGQHPSLDLEQAYQLAWGTLQRNPTRFSTPWRTPSELRTQKTAKDLSWDELKAAADAELRAMLW